ncbi:MAG: hypothetical protein A2Y10_17665 [Planctomycetes bacterium GWF2_41_51]|nr:MAG: hypothetical protein A2Y10_17665 [Planctomycetes bacterium GWF2_41_51]
MMAKLQNNKAVTVTMEAIAQDLDISISTVSRTFTRSHLVNATTRQKIKEYCEKLNYRPNLNARAIATKKTNTIGFLARNISQIQNFEGFAYNLEQILRQNGYSLQIELGHSEPDRENQIVESMLDRLIDGVIVCSRHYTGSIEAVETLRKSLTPFVVLGYYHDQTVNQIVEDLSSGARAITKHLIDFNHSKIALITYQEGDPRISGYKKACREAAIKIDDGLIYRVSPQMGNLDEIIDDLVKKGATALIAMHDQMAAFIYRICHRRKIMIPGDLAIASIACIGETDIWEPPLTVYEVSQEDFASSIGAMLLDKIRDPNAPTRIIHFGGRLIVRESTAGLR